MLSHASCGPPKYVRLCTVVQLTPHEATPAILEHEDAPSLTRPLQTPL